MNSVLRIFQSVTLYKQNSLVFLLAKAVLREGNSGVRNASQNSTFRFSSQLSLLLELVVLRCALGRSPLVRSWALDDEGERAVVSVGVFGGRLQVGLKAFKLGHGLGLSQGETLALLELLLAHERSNHADFLTLVFGEVEAELLGRPELHQVVIEGLLGDFDLFRGVLERQFDEFAILLIACVEQPPEAHGRDDVRDGALLDPTLPAAHVDSVCSDSPPILDKHAQTSVNVPPLPHEP